MLKFNNMGYIKLVEVGHICMNITDDYFVSS